MKKFVIVGTARTGSNHLINLINSGLPSVLTYGELFNLSSLEKNELEVLVKDPVMYLEQKTKAVPAMTKAVGFKLFYYHATKKGFGNNNLELLHQGSKKMLAKTLSMLRFLSLNCHLSTLKDDFLRVWEYLAKKNFYVIHLKRKNMLQTYLSLKKAYLTNRWTSESGGSELIAVKLAHDECKRFFEELESYEKQCDSFFKNNPKITIYYEDILSNPSQVMAELGKFFSLKVKNFDSQLKKQEKGSLSSSIKNYVQLKKSFSGTKWQKFFVD